MYFWDTFWDTTNNFFMPKYLYIFIHFLYAAEIQHFQSIFSQQDIQNITPYVIFNSQNITTSQIAWYNILYLPVFLMLNKE